MKYHLYDENYTHKGTFESIQEMRNFLCERKYDNDDKTYICLLYTSPSPRDATLSRMPSSA